MRAIDRWLVALAAVGALLVPASSAGALGGGGGKSPGPGGGGKCRKMPNHVMPIPRGHVRIVRATVYVDGKRVRVYRGHRLRRVRIPAFDSKRHRVRIVLVSSRGRRYATVRIYKGCGKSGPRRERLRAART